MAERTLRFDAAMSAVAPGNAVRRKLNSPDVSMSSLTIGEIQDGVCLDGVIELNDELPNGEQPVGTAPRVSYPLNRHLARWPGGPSG